MELKSKIEKSPLAEREARQEEERMRREGIIRNLEAQIQEVKDKIVELEK